MQRTYRFAGFELDTLAKELRRNGQRVPFSSLSCALLEHLIEHRERVVDAAELREQVWRGVKVGDGSLRQAIWELRQALADSAESQRIVRTVRGRGYQFIASLEELGTSLASTIVVQAAAPGVGDLVGRAAELQRLQSALCKARDVSGRAIVLVGGAGAGKSRLVQELRATVNIPFVEARGEPDRIAPALAAWRSIALGYADTLDAPRRALLAPRLPAALRMAAASPSAHAAWMEEPSEKRELLFADLASLIWELACERPSVIVLEDVQWLDEDSLLFLTRLAPLMSKTRCLLLLTCREPAGEAPHVQRALRSLRRLPDAEQLDLHPLTEEHVRELIEPLSSNADVKKLAAEIHQLAQGNALLTLELVRILATRDDPLNALRGCPEPLIPVLRRRLDAVCDGARAALGAAAVWGREFTLAELSAVLEEQPAETLTRLEPWLREGIVSASGPVSFRFAHPLYQEVAYAELTRAERAGLHRAAFTWLERQGADTQHARLSELTRHAGEAAAVGLARSAVVYSVRSAEQAYERAAFHSARLHVERALAFLQLSPDATPRERLTLALRRARMVRACGGDMPAINQLFLTLAQDAEQLGEPELFAEAVLGYTGHHAAGFSPSLTALSVDPSAVALVERALDALPQGSRALRTLLRCSLLYLLLPGSDRERRDQLANAVLAEARLCGDDVLLARALTTCVYACGAPDQTQSRIAYCNELVSLARKPGLTHLLPDALSTRAMCLLTDLQLELALRDTQEAQERAATHASQHTRARSRLLDLMMAFCRGDLEAAEKLSRASLDSVPHDLAERALFTVRMASVAMLREGLRPELLAFYERILLAYPDAVGFRCNLAGAYALSGQLEQAARHFDMVAEDDFRRLSRNLNTLSELTLLTGAAVELGCATRAQKLYERLLPHAHSMVLYVGEACPAGVVAMYLADLAVTMRRYETAEQWLRIADRLHERLGAEMFQVFTLVVRARLLHATRPEQPELARRLLRKVSAFGRERGILWLCVLAEHVGKKFGEGSFSTVERARVQLIAGGRGAA